MKRFFSFAISIILVITMIVPCYADTSKNIYDNELLFCGTPWLSSFEEVNNALLDQVFPTNTIIGKSDGYKSEFLRQKFLGVDNVPLFHISYNLFYETTILNHPLSGLDLYFVPFGNAEHFYDDDMENYGLMMAVYNFRINDNHFPGPVQSDLIRALTFLYGLPYALREKQDDHLQTIWSGKSHTYIVLRKYDDGSISLTYAYESGSILQNASEITLTHSYKGL